MPSLELDKCVAVLSQFSGRDKVIRSAYYALMFVAGRSKSQDFAEKLLVMAKQMSNCRLVARQFNDLPMVKANLVHFANPPKNTKVGQDRLNYDLTAAVNLLYTLYTPVEHIAWLSDLKLLPFESARWFKYCLYIWISALVCSIIKSMRTYSRLKRKIAHLAHDKLSDEYKKVQVEVTDEFLTLLQYSSDFANAINFVPHKGFLWAQTFPAWKTGLFGFIASFAGLLKIYRSVK